MNDGGGGGGVGDGWGRVWAVFYIFNIPRGKGFNNLDEIRQGDVGGGGGGVFQENNFEGDV